MPTGFALGVAATMLHWLDPEAALAAAERAPAGVEPEAAQYLVGITCRDEKHQVELHGRFHGEGLECKALLS